MKRKIFTMLAMSATLALQLSFAPFAADDFPTEQIGNIVYEMPENWELKSSDSGDTEIKTYSSGTAAVVFTFMPTEDMGELDDTMQKLTVDTVASTFESYNNYSEISSDYAKFEDYIAVTKSFSYDNDGTNCIASSAVMYTGEGICMVVFGGATAKVGSEDFEDFKNISASIRTNSTSTENSASQTELTQYDAGNYKVGVDIPAGEYLVFAKSGKGYFCVSSDSNQSDITFNDIFDYNSIITVKNGEYLELSKCYAVPLEEDPEVKLNGSGMFKVGTHIPAGEYKVEATDDRGYYCIYPDSRHQNIASNDIFEGQKYVTVSDGQYLILSKCKFADTPTKPVKTYSDSETVKKVQEALNAEGYDCGTPDGVAGSGTKGQIEKYQTDKGLTVTGTITDELLQSLGV